LGLIVVCIRIAYIFFSAGLLPCRKKEITACQEELALRMFLAVASFFHKHCPQHFSVGGETSNLYAHVKASFFDNHCPQHFSVGGETFNLYACVKAQT